MFSLPFIMAVFVANVKLGQLQCSNCDPISQSCSGTTCVCKATYQSDGVGGCCPGSLTVQSGMCFAVNKAGALTYPNAIKYCTAMGAGVNLITFDNQAQYSGVLSAIDTQLNDGTPMAMGLARSDGMGGYDSSADWVVLATQMPPDFAPFATVQANPTGTISYFLKKTGTIPPFTMGNPTDTPSFTVNAFGMTIPLTGFITTCRYYSGNNVAPTFTPPTGPGTLTTCSGGCPVGQFGIVSAFTYKLTCCSGVGDTSNCNSPYSCVKSVGSGYSCCQTGSASCPMPTIANAKLYWKQTTVGASDPQVGDSITVYCNDGYLLSGQQGFMCMSDNTWSSPMPTCTAVTCTQYGIGSNPSGCATAPEPFLAGQTVKFKCNNGTHRQDKNVRSFTDQCLPSGQWQEPFIGCDAMVENGNYIILGSLNVRGNPAPFASVSYTCADGYYLGGPGVITCQPDGSYNGTAPPCLLDDSQEFWWWPFILGFFLCSFGFCSICVYGCCKTNVVPANNYQRQSLSE